MIHNSREQASAALESSGGLFYTTAPKALLSVVMETMEKFGGL